MEERPSDSSLDLPTRLCPSCTGTKHILLSLLAVHTARPRHLPTHRIIAPSVPIAPLAPSPRPSLRPAQSLPDGMKKHQGCGTTPTKPTARRGQRSQMRPKPSCHSPRRPPPSSQSWQKPTWPTCSRCRSTRRAPDATSPSPPAPPPLPPTTPPLHSSSRLLGVLLGYDEAIVMVSFRMLTFTTRRAPVAPPPLRRPSPGPTHPPTTPPLHPSLPLPLARSWPLLSLPLRRPSPAPPHPLPPRPPLFRKLVACS